jgi:hexokinase
LTISDVKVKKLKATFEDELEKGLKAGLKASSLQMENTYVPELTNGKEEGCYLALDLGGTNFRVMFLEMTSGKIVKEEVTYYTVQEATRLGPGDKLFDFLAECIADFIHNKLGRDPNDPAMPLGFTFSFPMEQRGMDVGVLVSWTKSFNAAGVVGQDAVKMLNDAIKRQGNLNVNVVAILNDATGTLVKGAYDDSKTAIGLILGTGCNGAYLEEASKVVNWYGDRHDAKEVIIDPGNS